MTDKNGWWERERERERAKGTYASWYVLMTMMITLVNFGRLGWCNGLQARLANLHEWVQVTWDAPFIQPCAASEQKFSKLIIYTILAAFYATLTDSTAITIFSESKMKNEHSTCAT